MGAGSVICLADGKRPKGGIERGDGFATFVVTRVIIFPDTDFLFRRYQPPAHLLRGAGALKMSLLPSPPPYTLSPFSKGERVGVKGDRTPMYPAPSGPSS